MWARLLARLAGAVEVVQGPRGAGGAGEETKLCLRHPDLADRLILFCTEPGRCHSRLAIARALLWQAYANETAAAARERVAMMVITKTMTTSTAAANANGLCAANALPLFTSLLVDFLDSLRSSLRPGDRLLARAVVTAPAVPLRALEVRVLCCVVLCCVVLCSVASRCV